MSKTLQDYRNIVKILKYKLIKLRQQNQELENKIGSTQQQKSSSYKQKIKKYQAKNYIIAKNIVIFLTLADRCEILGISPEMIYRIADQKRQKKVSKQKFTQTLKRVKLKIDETMLYQLCSYIDINRNNFIQYQNYMKCLCAFQINTQKFPLKNPRSFTQISLIKFSRHCEKQSRNLEEVFFKINTKKQNQLNFEDFYSYGRKNITSMNQIQLTAVFIALDLEQNCFIDKNNFIREMNRAKNSGQLNDQQDNNQQQGQRGQKPKIKQNNNIDKKQKKQQFNQQIQTGVEAKNANKTKDKQQTKQTKKMPTQIAKALNILRSNKLTLQPLLNKLLDQQSQKQSLKSFSFLDIYQASLNISKTVNKSDLQTIFKQIDLKNNGTLSNYQILKFWLSAREKNQSILVLFRILKRQLTAKKIQITQYFKSMNISQDNILSQDIFSKLFKSLKLDKQQIKQLLTLIGKIKIIQFIKNIQNYQQSKKQQTIFKKIDRNKTDIFDNIIKKIKPQLNDQDYYLKLNRQNKNNQKWKTIFTNQWACWKWCYQTMKSLTSYWRDPQFGPNGNDKFGFNSIVGNLNEPPIGIPPQQEIQWVNHLQLTKRKNEGKLNFYDQNIKSGSIDQGSIGNCWFISAVSIITQDQKYIKGQKLQNINANNIQNITKGVIPQIFAGFRNYGMFVFKFFKNYKSVYVVVDDLIPVQLGSSDPLFAHSHQVGIQWPSLIQKAYAKLHNTYSALISGDIAQGLSDLTSCLPIKQAVDKKLQQQFWKKLYNYQSTKQLMGCSITPPPKTAVQKPVQLDGQNCGLVYGHAYSISDVFQIQDKKSQEQFKLLRVRNPWGQGQWVLQWSQNPRDGDVQNDKLKKYSKQIQQYYNKKIKQAKQRREQVEGYEVKQDGIFLMSYYDWLNVYTSLFVGLNLSEKYSGKFIKDRWTQQVPSGIVSPSKASKSQKQNFVKKNYQYRMSLTQDADILIILSQIDGRLFRGEKYPYTQICNPCIILVFKINQKDGALKSFQKQLMYSQSFKIQTRREITFWKKFQKGTYIIIPVTTNYTNNQFEDKYPDFELAVYFDCDQKSINLKKIGDDKQFKTIQKNQKIQNKNQKQIQQLLKKLVQIKNNL